MSMNSNRLTPNRLHPVRYFVLVQHPMMNAEFDIYYDSSTGRVINRQLGTGTSIFQLTGQAASRILMALTL